MIKYDAVINILLIHLSTAECPEYEDHGFHVSIVQFSLDIWQISRFTLTLTDDWWLRLWNVKLCSAHLATCRSGKICEFIKAGFSETVTHDVTLPYEDLKFVTFSRGPVFTFPTGRHHLSVPTITAKIKPFHFLILFGLHTNMIWLDLLKDCGLG